MEVISKAALNWSPLFSSQSLEDVGEIHRALQKEHERLCTLVTPVSGLYWGTGAGKTWLSLGRDAVVGHIHALRSGGDLWHGRDGDKREGSRGKDGDTWMSLSHWAMDVTSSELVSHSSFL